MSGCLVVFWLLLYSIYRATHALASGGLRFSFVLKHFVYPHLFPRIRFVGVATRLEGLAILVYLLINLVLVLAGKRTNIGSRAATMSIVNVIPLLCGPRLSLVARLMGVSRYSSLWSHRWFGRTVLVQVLVHTIISLTGSSSFAWTAAKVFGAVVRAARDPKCSILADIPCKASFAFGFIFLTSIGFVRHAIYEWFLNSHMLLSLLIVLAAWRHVPSKTPAWVLIRIAMGLWAGATAIHWLVFAFRNLAWRRPLAAVVATRLSSRDPSDHALVDPLNVLRVDITVPRPWRIEAGQSIFLSIPSLGVFTGLRGHPFMISWWERDENGLKISLLVQSRAGFTAKLGEHPQKVLRAFIDGPYGGQYNFGDYGTVIMLASGIGIAGHMPYIKDLIRAYNSCEARTRRVLLIWHVEDERKCSCRARQRQRANSTRPRKVGAGVAS
jgi:predicted ferric reductase